MAASYPSSAKSFGTLNAGDTIQDTDIEAAYDELAAIEAALLTTGLAHTLKFVDATYDIGATATFRPRDLFLSRNAVVGGTLGVTGVATFTAAPVFSAGLGTVAGLTLSAGLAFPATQAASANANTLDDYEEGTWTPVLGGSGGTSGQTYISQTGSYVKIGKWVFVTGRVRLSVKGTITTIAQIQGLPFASSSSSDAGALSVVFFSLGASKVYVTGFINGTSTAYDLQGIGAAATSVADLVAADIGNATDLFFTAHYPTTA